MKNKSQYPRTTSKRRVIDMDGMWNFKFDRDGRGDLDNWKEGLKASSNNLPSSSFKDLFLTKEEKEFTGNIWYETNFYIPGEWEGMKLDIIFGPATHFTTVYVNGKEIASHKEGGLPFNANINDVVKFNMENLLVVKVNNELSKDILPAGLERYVKLLAIPKENVEDFTLNYTLEGSDVRVDYVVDTNGGHQVRITIYDEDSSIVAQTEGKKNAILIEDVKLWNANNPYLYTFKFEIIDDGGKVILDEYIEEVGIRIVEV